MRAGTALALVLLVTAGAAAPVRAQATVLTDAVVARQPSNVRVTARIVVIDSEAVRRAGLSYAVLGSDRVRYDDRRRARAGVSGAVNVLGVTAFLEAIRSKRLIRSESTQQVLTLSGAEAHIGSQNLTMGRRSARTEGPRLIVTPTVLADGRVHLRVSAAQEDVATSYRWGYPVDGSPASVETEVIAGNQEEVILGSGSSVETVRESGILRWGDAEYGREILVVVSAQVVR